ncbi:MAG: PrsW family glutamic-type intramembrane protease [Candidatus Micrarchaeota archaeon]|nr:PrsW family glutamic-type intramembrane protease [Candidatus Micrarchaeota archaeon]
MAGKISQLNTIFLVLLLVIGGCAISISIIELFALPALLPGESAVARLEAVPVGLNVSVDNPQGIYVPEDSPFVLNLTASTPEIRDGEVLRVYIIANGTVRSAYECKPSEEDGTFTGKTQVQCSVEIPYAYIVREHVTLYPVLEHYIDGPVYRAEPVTIDIDWDEYDSLLWGYSIIILFFVAIAFAVMAAISIIALYVAAGARHDEMYEGEYSLTALLLPFRNAGTLSEKWQALIASPWFWLVELAGISILLFYIMYASNSLISFSAFFAFILCGLLAFITPFLWAVLMWLADYKEREPLRIVVSLFLWGGLAGLMSIGLNSILGAVLVAIGIGFLSAMLIAPLVEEFFKGMGIAVFSLHHELNNMVDGLVYGFIIGMGFAFVENWLYLMNNPMGANTGAWLTVFILRSFVFSATHGVFTSLTGAIIGYLKEKEFAFPTLSLLVAPLPAMFLHAAHNSMEFWSLFGNLGMAAYCCILLPMFDYGGLAFVMALLVIGVFLMQPFKAKRRQQ